MTKDIARGTAEERAKAANEIRRRIIAPRPTRSPDWAVWNKVRSAPLWEAVAVSCGIEPSDIRGWKAWASRCIPPQIFEDRLRIAASLLDVNKGGLPSMHEDGTSDTARVDLGDFRAWMESQGILMPPEFPRNLPKSPPRESAEARKMRLTLRLAELKNSGVHNFNAVVASEERIKITTLKKIVGKLSERKERLAQR